jgi:hypothetical protein
MKNIEKLLKELYDDNPNVEALLKDKKNLAKLTDDKLFTKANDHVNSLLVGFNQKSETQREQDGKWYWVMWNGMVKLWHWHDSRKPPKEPSPQRDTPPLTLESLEYRTNNDKRDLPEWP